MATDIGPRHGLGPTLGLVLGALGALLAVPLTATIKVLLARYVWGERLREEVSESIEEVPVVQEARQEAAAATR
jgi:hypothetical protein